MTKPHLLIPPLFAWLLAPSPLLADAIVVTQAMLADTIAEIFIEDDRVLVELDIGFSDLDSFRNLMPDALYEKLGHPAEPEASRMQRFFEEDLVLIANGDSALRGRVLELIPRSKVDRDPITGEPLEDTTGDDIERVIFARLEYALPERPATLTIRGPHSGSVGIGFVAYHLGVAVNDFRYLTPNQTLELNWDDPWYSRFGARSMRRRYFAPMNGFLYIEEFEVRKEIVARPLDLQDWIDLGLEGRETIPVEMQPELKRKVAAFLRERQPVLIDGVSIEPELARINFLDRTLRSSRVIDPPVELDVYSAMLGVIFVYPISGLPQQVTMEWDLWNESIQKIPTSTVDQAGPLPGFVEPDSPVLVWQNFLKHPKLSILEVIERPPTAWERLASASMWPLLATVLMLGLLWLRSRRALLAASACGLALVASITFAWGRRAELTDERARVIVGGLLHNIYRAFDHREEGRVYDVLARSVEGELLARIYLETRRSLELASQGGARAKVKEIELVDVTTDSLGGGAFVADASWNVTGAVGHWGHVHRRRNHYRARLEIVPSDGAWRLAEMEVMLEERL
jgi:hypothetical protein